MVLDEQEVTPALGHNLSKNEAREASCTEDGCGEYYECDRCHGLFADEDGSVEITEKPVIGKLGHSLNKVEAKEASCTEDGYDEYYECGRCHRLFADDNGSEEITEKPVTGKLGHSLNIVEAKEASCTEEGCGEYYECGRCHRLFASGDGSEELTEKPVIAKIAHSLAKVEAKEATCIEEGVSEHWRCNACGQYFADDAGTSAISEEDTIVPKSEHQWDEGTETEAPTCIEEGVKKFECSVCHVTKTESIPAAGHKWNTSYTTDKAATQTSKGSKSIHCSVCNEIKPGSSTDIAALAPPEKMDLPVVKISKPKAAKNKVTVKWTKVSKKNLKKIQGIEIQVATDSGFKQIVKSTTAGKKKTSKVIKGLKPKTTYWVRIRAYRNAADGKHVSAWKWKKVKLK